MWWMICSTQVKTFQKRSLTSKHKKFGVISGVVVVTCAISWLPSALLYLTNSYSELAYYCSLGLHYLITVSNPIVYIWGTQGNVGQALLSTPMQYRRRISRSSMYNSETVHRNCVAGPIALADSIHRPSLVGRRSVGDVSGRRMAICQTSFSFPPTTCRRGSRFSRNSTNLELISESEFRSSDCIVPAEAERTNQGSLSELSANLEDPFSDI